ncbi:MAG: oxidoreductase, partial [Pseudomonadota bacterium]|nr:oxidoreductase [Pseudomonadota bacterium]
IHRSYMAGSAVVALHGSWNRSSKDGYKVVSLHWDANGISAQDFLTGFLLDDDVIGRPAEVAEDRHGNIYVSDDFANAVYRVSRTDAAL